MWQVRFLLALGLVSFAVPCSADLIVTLTPTARIDFQTQVQITYTLTGASSGPGTQNVGEFSFRVTPGSLPTASNIALVFNPTIAQAGSPWADPKFGTRGANIDANNRVTFDAFTPVFGNFTQINTTGGVVGTFDIIWNRPLTGQYDAAITTSQMTAAYSDAADGSFPLSAIRATSLNVSTIITAVPEPSTVILFSGIGVAVCIRRIRSKSVAYLTRLGSVFTG